MTSPGPKPEPTCYRHPDRVTYVQCTRCGRYVCGEDQVPAPVGVHCPEDVKRANAGLRRARTAYGGRLSSGADVTRVLLGVNVVLFAAALLTGGSLVLGGGDSPLYRLLALQPVALLDDSGLTPGIVDGQFWRLVSAMFLHYGTLHLLLNMLALLQLGPDLEQALGRTRFLLLYLLSGLAGSAASYALGPQNARGAGASGALYGLAGAWYLLQRRRRADTRPAVVFLAFGLLLSVTVPGIDLRAHVGGLLGGLAAGAALLLGPPGPGRPRRQVTGMVLLATIVAGVVAARTVDLRRDDAAAALIHVEHVLPSELEANPG